MNQAASWDTPNSQPISGGVQMFNPSEFTRQVQASEANQNNYGFNSTATEQQTYTPNSIANTHGYIPNVSSNQQAGEQSQTYQTHNSWNSWNSWSGGDGGSGSLPQVQQNVYTTGETSNLYLPQQQEGHAPQSQQKEGYSPKQQEGYSTQQQELFHSQQQEVYSPQQQEVYSPQQQEVYSPQQQEGYPPHHQEGYPPQQHGGIGQWFGENSSHLTHDEQNIGYQQQPVPINDQWQGFTQTNDFTVQASQQQNLYSNRQYPQHIQANIHTLPEDQHLQNSYQYNQNNVKALPTSTMSTMIPLIKSSDFQNSQPVLDDSANQYLSDPTKQNTNEMTDQFVGTNPEIPETYQPQSKSSLGYINDNLVQQVTGQLQNVSLESHSITPKYDSPQQTLTVGIPLLSDPRLSEDGEKDSFTEEEPQNQLNDWEFVNSIPSSSSQHSRQNSLENSSSIVVTQPSHGVQTVSHALFGESVDPFNVNISSSHSSDKARNSDKVHSMDKAHSSDNGVLSSASSLSTCTSVSSNTVVGPSLVRASQNNQEAFDSIVKDDGSLSLPNEGSVCQTVSSIPTYPVSLPTAVTSNIDVPHPVSMANKHVEILPSLPVPHKQLSMNDKPKIDDHNSVKNIGTQSKSSQLPSASTSKSAHNNQTQGEVRSDETESLSSGLFSSTRWVEPSSPRKHNSAFKPIHRAKHNMSPAATLWDDLSPPKITNVLLAPAAPSVNEPSSVPTSTSPPTLKSKGRDSRREEQENKYARGSDSESFSDSPRSRYKGHRRHGSDNWKKDDDNKSLDSLDEVNSKMDYRDRRYKEQYDARDPYSRYEYRDDQDTRYQSRSSSAYYKNYEREPYYQNESYERPRSRNNDEHERDITRPRSRIDYEGRDTYYRERYRGYDYEPRRRYYDEMTNYDLDYLYSQGYYSEYYGHQGYNASYDNHGRLSRPTSRQSGEYDEVAYRHEAQDACDNRYYYYQQAYDYNNQPYNPYVSYKDKSYHRLTPPKYAIPHMKVCFGANAQLVKILPNKPADGQPAVVEIQELEPILTSTKSAEEIREFPGPLIRGETHKNDVLLLCQRKSKQCSEDVSMVDRESAELTWRLLELLIKQNGTVIGTDIADLLLEGHEPTTYDYSMTGMKIATSLDNLDTAVEKECAVETKVTSNRTVVSQGTPQDDLTDRFRHLLLYGRKKDALEWAMKKNIWGHALFLASKMDTRTHANVMTKFANSAMKMNDPLQTLYQLMSGRQPAAVTCMSDDRWGDWRPHLAMILSNTSSKTDVDRKSIATLGDTLAAKGCLHASHFCYLMAQISFGVYSKKASKIVLIGSSHNLPLEEFATNQAIQCTEIYEYAQSLGNSSFVLPQLQVFKFLYACRLAELGLSQDALQYCEVISRNIQHSPVYYQPTFVKGLYELSCRLKYYDPARQYESEDSADPDWLQNLSAVCHGYDDGTIQPISGSATPAGLDGTTTSSDSGEVAAYTTNTASYSASQYQNYTQDGNYIDTNHQQQHTQHQYQQSHGQFNQSQDQDHSQYNQSQDYIQDDSQYKSQYQQTATSNQDVTGSQTDGQDASYLKQLQSYNQQWSQFNQQQGYLSESNPQPSKDATNTDQHNYNYHQANQNTLHEHTGQHSGYYQQTGVADQHGYYQQPQPTTQNHVTDGVEEEDEEDDDEDDDEEEEDDAMAQSGSFDYFGSVASQKVIPPNSRIHTNSTSSSVGTPRKRTTSGSSSGSISAANPKNKHHDKRKEELKSTPKDGGWSITGMFGWGKKKKEKHKEIILPDDKDPKIVWDPVAQKWTNPNEAETSASTAAPPPKDTDLMGTSVKSLAPPTSGNPSGNRFSLKSAGGSRNQYVDVFNPNKTSVSPVPSNLLNTQSNNNMYVPANADVVSNSNPVPLGGDNKLSDIHKTAQSEEKTTKQTAPPGMPVMFDPTQFQEAKQPNQGGGQGLKYGQRRKYPK